MRKVVALAGAFLIMSAGGGVASARDPPHPNAFDQSPNAIADKVLDLLRRDDASLLEALHASPDAADVLGAYDAADFHDVAADIWSAFRPSRGEFETQAEASTSDKFAQVRGFKVEIQSESSQGATIVWESVPGGELQVAVAQTFVSKETFDAHGPGHKHVAEIELRGAMTEPRRAIDEWIRLPETEPEELCERLGGTWKTVVVYDAEGKVLWFFRFCELVEQLWGDQAMGFYVEPDAIGTFVLDVTKLDGKGALAQLPPRSLLAFPLAGPPGSPVGAIGQGFDAQTLVAGARIESSFFRFDEVDAGLLGTLGVGYFVAPHTSADFSVAGTTYRFAAQGHPLRAALTLHVEETTAVERDRYEITRFRFVVDCENEWKASQSEDDDESPMEAASLNFHFDAADAATASFLVDREALSSTEIQSWYTETRKGKNIRKNITVSVFKSDKTPGRSYSLVDCFPIAYSSTDDDSSSEGRDEASFVKAGRIEFKT